jgi:hypothetical protein
MGTVLITYTAVDLNLNKEEFYYEYILIGHGLTKITPSTIG